MLTNRATNAPLTIGVEGDQLVIRVGCQTLAHAFEASDENQSFDEKADGLRRDWKVTNAKRFAEGVANALSQEAEGGSTPLTRILDDAFTKSVENDMGVKEDGRLVTSAVLKG